MKSDKSNTIAWPFADDFAQLLVTKDKKTVRRMLTTADVALTFARALVAREYQVAQKMLTAKLRRANSPAKLQRNLERMIHYNNDDSRWPVHVVVVAGTDAAEMPKKQAKDFGCTYVAIDGIGYCEAVAVVVVQDAKGFAIREVEWGRP